MVLVAGASVFSLAALTALAPPPQSSASESGQGLSQAALAGGVSEQQSLQVTGAATAPRVLRDEFDASDGLEVLSAGTTNHDWAKLVLFMAGFPTTDSNIAVMTRWMRQENGPDNWWLRNNPLNNGWGSGGGSGLGSYDNLVTAAANVGYALHGNHGYSAIVAGFSSSAPTSQIEAAIWASPWATSHYGSGSHWSTSPVPVVASPAGTWG